ncbi:hypothetical protein Moror_1394 [Moniliophthora roreri MCA 2997]|uniref:Uncharacterized protein n=2 Tax=Moniliophthora roreri TaxID=221103 RepID=V2WRL2_MONRO|nr:hypothetical protein Moror_1394 [Moniliophthora roreri MCA 2997]KAI3597605.1 hypothetical protein WG66_003146 [Moniliophthora roreri]
MSILRSSQSSLLPAENPSPNDTNNYLIYGIPALLLSLAATLWPYIQSRYPCFTTSELTAKQKKVDQVYNMALATVSLVRFGDELQEKERKLNVLKRRASQIRSRDLTMNRMSQSIWRIYLGFHPSLVADIVVWYKDAEDLEWDIQLLVESDTQRRLEVKSVTPTDTPNRSNSLSHVVPVSSHRDTPPRRQQEGSSRHRHRRPSTTITG